MSRVIKAGHQPSRYTRFSEILDDVQSLVPEVGPGIISHSADLLEAASTLQVAQILEADRESLCQQIQVDAIAQARQEAEAIKQTAREAGYQEGFEKGYQAAGQRCQNENEVYLTSLRGDVEALVGNILQERHRLLKETEPEIVRLVLEIARKVIREEISANPSQVMGIVKHALRRITDKARVRIRVSLEDLPLVKEHREELVVLLDGIEHLEIIDDQRVGAGGCIIETNAGNIDARIETQLEQIETAFLEV